MLTPLLLLVSLSAGADAQLPIRMIGSESVAPAEAEGEIEAPMPTAAAAAVPPPEQTRDDSAAALLNLLRNTPPVTSPSATSQPVTELEVAPGVNHIVTIARNQVNRLVTPFRQPVIKTVANITTENEQGIVYVASSDTSPVGLYIHETGDPRNAVSLTLVPREVPPVEIRVTLKGYQAPAHDPIVAGSGNGKLIGAEQAFVSDLTQLFSALARQSVPEGYALSGVDATHPRWPDCPMTGLFELEPAQLLAGADVLIFVARVQNVGFEPQIVEEQDCAGPGVLAVAVWPERYLGPGQSAELYLAVPRREPEIDKRRRPSLLTVETIGGGHGY